MSDVDQNDIQSKYNDWTAIRDSNAAAQRLTAQLMRQAQRAKSKTMPNYKRDKRDENEPEITEALTLADVRWRRLKPGDGADLIVKPPYQEMEFVEVKMPGRNKLTEAEADLKSWCDTHGVIYRVFHHAQDALVAYRPLLKVPVVGTRDAHGIEYAQTPKPPRFVR